MKKNVVSTTTTRADPVQLIVNLGWYSEFCDFFSTCVKEKKVKSRKRCAVMFIRHKGWLSPIDKYTCCPNLKDILKVSWL